MQRKVLENQQRGLLGDEPTLMSVELRYCTAQTVLINFFSENFKFQNVHTLSISNYRLSEKLYLFFGQTSRAVHKSDFFWPLFFAILPQYQFSLQSYHSIKATNKYFFSKQDWKSVKRCVSKTDHSPIRKKCQMYNIEFWKLILCIAIQQLSNRNNLWVIAD